MFVYMFSYWPQPPLITNLPLLYPCTCIDQIRHMLALTICVMNKWLPVEYFYAALDPGSVLEVPALPGFGLMLSECRYDRWEAKYSLRLDPRRVDGADTARIENWKYVVKANIAKHYSTVANGDPAAMSALFLGNMQSHCRNLCVKYYSMLALTNRVCLDAQLKELTETETETADSSSSSKLSALFKTAPPAYAKVLRLLREADASGLWPASSHARTQYIENAPAIEKFSKKTGKKIIERVKPKTGPGAELMEGVIGGSFSIGCYPKPLLQPKGNDIFPGNIHTCNIFFVCVFYNHY
jgi:hypothetical protein